MASTGTVYVADTVVNRRGQVQSWGRLKIGHNATLEARDFSMKSLMSVVATPIGLSTGLGGLPGNQLDMVLGSIGSSSTKAYRRSFLTMMGSIGSVGGLNNYYKTRVYMVSTYGSEGVRNVAPQGTRGIYIGTQPGSYSAAFFATGR